jgi:hypothetical protein
MLVHEQEGPDETLFRELPEFQFEKGMNAE